MALCSHLHALLAGASLREGGVRSGSQNARLVRQRVKNAADMLRNSVFHHNSRSMAFFNIFRASGAATLPPLPPFSTITVIAYGVCSLNTKPVNQA